jgi:predicted glutamine amidotransferase
MCRLVGWVSEQPRSLAEVLGPETLRRFVELSSVHGDGWGIAWTSPTGPEVRRSTAAARVDETFMPAAHEITATAAVVHLRWATPGFGIGLRNTHPFLCGEWAMAHNGSIGPSTAVAALLAPGSARPAGTTDSEHFFQGVLGSLPAAGHGLAAAIEATSTRGADAGLGSSSLNSIFLGPAGLDVLTWHDPAQAPVLPLAGGAAGGTSQGTAAADYYDLSHRSSAGLDVVVSSGFVPERAGWHLLPSASLTHIPFSGGMTRRYPIAPCRPLCPDARQAP